MPLVAADARRLQFLFRTDQSLLASAATRGQVCPRKISPKWCKAVQSGPVLGRPGSRGSEPGRPWRTGTGFSREPRVEASSTNVKERAGTHRLVARSGLEAPPRKEWSGRLRKAS